MGSPTVEIPHPNGTVVYSNTVSGTEHTEVLCARGDTVHRTVVCVDDGSEVTLLRRSIAIEHGARTRGERINITGIGANQVGTGASKVVTIPLRSRSSVEVTVLPCCIVTDEILPAGIDALVGTQP